MTSAKRLTVEQMQSTTEFTAGAQKFCPEATTRKLRSVAPPSHSPANINACSIATAATPTAALTPAGAPHKPHPPAPSETPAAAARRNHTIQHAQVQMHVRVQGRAKAVHKRHAARARCNGSANARARCGAEHFAHRDPSHPVQAACIKVAYGPGRNATELGVTYHHAGPSLGADPPQHHLGVDRRAHARRK